jgi:hypothetical protein
MVLFVNSAHETFRPYGTGKKFKPFFYKYAVPNGTYFCGAIPVTNSSELYKFPHIKISSATIWTTHQGMDKARHSNYPLLLQRQEELYSPERCKCIIEQVKEECGPFHPRTSIHNAITSKYANKFNIWAIRDAHH